MIKENKLPWGKLTGVRPTKLVHKADQNGLNAKEINAYLEEVYHISPEKRQLMQEVAERERAILSQNKPNEMSLYIGIPFCPTRCIYCSFTSYALEQNKAQVAPYLSALFKEIEFVAHEKAHTPIRSLYIGGGTPTSLNETELEQLLIKIASSFDLKQIEEYTIEAGRPDTITKEKLALMKAYGVGRISINPQSMNQKTLDVIGRKHTVEDVKTIFKLARQLGPECINMDMILGLPNETVEDVAHTLEELKKLDSDNITVHTMAIKRASKLNEVLREDETAIQLTQANQIERMLTLCQDKMKEMGLYPYYLYRQKNMLGNFENVGYAKLGKESIYNIEIMEEAETIVALGAGGITKIVYPDGKGIERIPNVKSLKDYIERIDEMIERKEKAFKTV